MMDGDGWQIFMAVSTTYSTTHTAIITPEAREKHEQIFNVKAYDDIL